VGTHSSLGYDLQNQLCIVIAMKVEGWEKRKLVTDCWKSLEVFHLCSLEGYQIVFYQFWAREIHLNSALDNIKSFTSYHDSEKT
jgi:hypothetical protein